MRKWIAVGIALAMLSGGTAEAASRYLITSRSQIAPRVLRELRGAQGPQGPQGAPGAPGAQGAPPTLHYSQAHASAVVAAGMIQTVYATCPQGLPMGGGYVLSSPATITGEVPSGDGFEVTVQAPQTNPVTINVYAQCLGGVSWTAS